MKEALELINSNKIYKKIFEEIYSKYKSHGKITGSFTIKPKSQEETQILLNFDPKVVYEGKAKIKSSVVESLFKRKLKKHSFLELMEVVVDKEVITNKEIKLQEKEKVENFFQKVINESLEGIGKQWFENLFITRGEGYRLIIIRYHECKNTEMLKRLINDLTLVNDSLNNLPYKYKETINIAIFAANRTKNPHFFDYNTYTGKLLIHGIRYIFNKGNNNSLDAINELYYDAGLLKDEISNHTTIWNLKAFDQENHEVMSVNLFEQWEEPLQISISNLIKIKYFNVVNNEVYVFENPAVFNSIRKALGNRVSLICTSGQLNLSSYIILNKICNLKTLYYAGDFDPEGLLIANSLKLRYKEKVKFLLYDKVNYEKIKSSNKIDNNRINKLNKITCKELMEIKESIQETEKAAYQELLIDEYIKTIKTSL